MLIEFVTSKVDNKEKRNWWIPNTIFDRLMKLGFHEDIPVFPDKVGIYRKLGSEIYSKEYRFMRYIFQDANY